MLYSVTEENGEVSFWFGIHPELDPNRTWLCLTTAEQAPAVESLLRDGLRLEYAYAEVLWLADDVQQLMESRELPVSMEWAREFLATNANNIRGLMTERGWQALEQLLPATAPELAAWPDEAG